MTAQFRFDTFVLDCERRELTRDGDTIELSSMQLSLLEILIRRQSSAVARQEISDRLWPDSVGEETSVDQLVSEVRRILGDDTRTILRTVHGFGYAFVAALEQPSPWELVIGDRRHQLFSGANLVGRNRNAAVDIDDPAVSRRHALLRVDPGWVIVEDLGSRNGTFLRGGRVSSTARAQAGDALRFGSVPAVLLRAFFDESASATASS